MKYNNIVVGNFVVRDNRFIGKVNINGNIETVHIKNTGRCKELLTDNATVICQYFSKEDFPNRKTRYDLVAVYKGNMLINMDSQAPNKVVREFIDSGNFCDGITYVKPEYKYGDSRLDFYIEQGKKKILMEVKGVTLEQDGVAMFPDAPTQRGIKHIYELIKAIENGYEAYIIFVIQLKGVEYFTPNNITHEAFGKALKEAEDNGVKILCYDCIVAENSLCIDKKIKYKL